MSLLFILYWVKADESSSRKKEERKREGAGDEVGEDWAWQ